MNFCGKSTLDVQSQHDDRVAAGAETVVATDTVDPTPMSLLGLCPLD